MRFDSYYILKKICVKTGLICLLIGAHVSSILITLSSPCNTLYLCIFSTVRLLLNKYACGKLSAGLLHTILEVMSVSSLDIIN